ncbi:MAG: F-type H+-transporting ATPase subunit b [Desulfonauticus sp.]|jgi:F-type H+-transporting ATPase subunit b|nr:F-type H+-transporting ATPase subunit b [Desulfonauticus sp.]
MIELNFTFFVQLVNFLIALLVLNLILFRPIRENLRKRAELMASRLEEIEKFSNAAEEKLSSYEVSLDEARKQAQEIRSKLKEEGYAEEKSLVEAAMGEAAGVIKSAREKFEQERNAALKSLEAKVSDYAAKVASKILGEA